MTRHWPLKVIALVAAMNAQADMLDKTGMAAWETCALCHSADGVSAMPKFPKLAGQKAAYIESQLMHFRHGRRTNDGGQMQTISVEVELQDLKEISAYFSSLPLPELPGSEEKNLTKVARGKVLFYQGENDLPACATCHADERSAAPWLDGQHRSYIVKQLKDFREGKRRDFTEGKMPAIAAKLTDDDVESVAIFLEMERIPRD